MPTAVDKNTDVLVEKDDLVNIAILSAAAIGIGVYLIATTVLIAKDGVLYIEQARRFSSDTMGVIQADPPFGYPFLIFIAHRFASLFTDCSSVYGWIYPAQSVSLLCRLLSLVPLYFIGKLLVGAGRSFWAVLILVVLPYPARIGSDVLRDWPHIFFLAAGFWAILYAVEKGKSWTFGLAGLSSGFGYIIRPECVQLAGYGIVWLVYCLLRPAKPMGRGRTVQAVVLLLLGFLIPVVPYAKAKGALLPPKVRTLINSFSFGDRSNESKQGNPCGRDQLPQKYAAGPVRSCVDALYNIHKDIGESLMWIFALPWLIGIFHWFRAPHTNKGKFLMSVFIAANIVLLLLRSTHFDKAMSKRYVLPLIAFTIFYIPAGLEIISHKISRKRQGNLFYVLLMIGLSICMPKLLRPIGIDKDGYKKAAKWLNENAREDAMIAVPDLRISLYAERKGLIYAQKIPETAKYAVSIAENEDEMPDFGKTARKRYSVWVDGRKNRGEKLVIYGML
ncbi:MAG TPA: glycosyltransferase family 39 protein [Sedimentisphaerales bacterium]|nr:glycosyltransferase family 39 protein [Sedimentisphaerales bacterium]